MIAACEPGFRDLVMGALLTGARFSELAALTEALRDVPRLGPKAFELPAGFLRIRDGDDPLDWSGVHPEAYPVVRRVLTATNSELKALIDNAPVLRKLLPETFVDRFGVPTVTDILRELEKPRRDPRPAFKTANFIDGIEKLADLKLGMVLEGVVTNVAAFGAFVDVGVHQDGLVHISAMTNTFVKDPRAIVKSGDVVRVKVIEVDPKRRRISLTMRLDEAAPTVPATTRRTPMANRPDRGPRDVTPRPPSRQWCPTGLWTTMSLHIRVRKLRNPRTMFICTLGGLRAAGMIKSLVNDTTRSARFLTAADGMGFSYNDNRVAKGSDATLWYKHHWEANYIVSGRGELTDLTSGERWVLEPGVLYVVGPNDRHRFRVTEDEHHVSVFYPPLMGDERHDKDGAYEASGPAPKTDRRMFVKRADEMRAAGKEIVVANGQARTIRMLTQADDVGFGLSDVHFDAGAETVLWYKHHWEANHILAGAGAVTDLTTGESWDLEPGKAYNVGPRDRHRLRASTDLHLLSVFSPALKGDEQHDDEGTLSSSGPTPPGRLIG